MQCLAFTTGICRKTDKNEYREQNRLSELNPLRMKAIFVFMGVEKAFILRGLLQVLKPGSG